MNILYITDYRNDFEFDNYENEKIYIINISNNTIKRYYNSNVKELKIFDYNLGELKLGPEFILSYKLMKTVKSVIIKYCIDKIIFSCQYIDAYFTLQYIRYGGEIEKGIEVYDNKCYKKMINKNNYKFPDYWISEIEDKCKELFNYFNSKKRIETLPKLSIIIPYYNLGSYIYEALESIRKSTYENYEILIVNDGSSDVKSREILELLKNDKDLTIINQENKGLSAARNIGVKNSTGDYITFLDADDLIENDYYKRAINVLENNLDIDIVYSWVRYFENKEEVWPTFDLSMPYLLLSNMSAAFYVVRREKYIEYGLNNENMKQGMEDYDSLISMFENGCKGVSIPEPLVKYRYRLGSMSKSYNPEIISNIYNNIVDNHQELYKKYSVEIIKIMNSNGPGYLWNNPTLYYPSVCLNYNEDVNDIKYILIRLINTKLGKIFVKILKYCYKRK